VLDGTTVFAGPRTVDLRSEAADVLGGEPVDIQLGRHRWRLRSGEVAPSTPMRGLVYLEWGDAASVEPVPPFERLPFLIANSVLGPTVRDSTAYLELAGLPTLRFTRPRRLDVLDATMSQLVDALA
jgi:hypothetical protein